jgi:6-pyruvoyltetrahydropterin/6-carboxytetrahydropterin synthase
MADDMGSRVRVTREFTFEAAHVLRNYDGPCRNVHGHSYRLFVTVSGVPSGENENPKCGMVIDFGDLKKIVMEKIVNIFDHAVVVSRDFDNEKLNMMSETFGNTVITDYQPTCENMVADFAGRLIGELPAGISLHSLRLYETAKSYTEWFASDNEQIK